jgi:hypothetical protein
MTAVYMVAYTIYATDPRVRREAETLASLPDYDVTVVVPRMGASRQSAVSNGVHVVELSAGRYWGKSVYAYLLSYLKFLLAAFLDCTRRSLSGGIDVVHIHNMPNFLIFCAVVPQKGHPRHPRLRPRNLPGEVQKPLRPDVPDAVHRGGPVLPHGAPDPLRQSPAA